MNANAEWSQTSVIGSYQRIKNFINILQLF